MLAMIAFSAVAAASDCVESDGYIIIEDDLMMIADDVGSFVVGGAEITTSAGLLYGEGEALTTASAASLEEGALAEGWVIEDDIIYRSDLTIEEGSFLIAGMGTEVLIFFMARGPIGEREGSDGSVFEDNVVLRMTDYVFEDDVILRTSGLIVGTAAALEGEVPEDAIQLVSLPRCH